VFDRRSKLLGTVTLLQDLAVTCVAFVAAYYLRTLLAHFNLFSEHPAIYPFGHYLSLMVGFLVAWAAVGYASRFYRDLEMSNPIQLVLNLLNQLAIVLVILYAGLYLFRRGDISRTYVLLVGVVDLVLLIAARYVSYNGIAWMRRKLGRYHYFLIVGCGSRAHEMATLIEESRGMGLRLVGFVDPASESSKLSDRLGRYDVFPMTAVERVLHERVIDEVVFAVSMQELARLEPLMSYCANVGVKTRVQLEFLPAPYSRIYLENFRDVPLLSLSTAPESELLLFFKRVGDVLISAFSLVFLSPLLAAVAAAIRISSPGEVLFRQTRCGLGGRRFTLYKFRSMVNNAEQLRAELHQFNERDGPAFKISDDPRITSVGRVLRRFSLDELPQLWNILRGDMSFVGPRPAIPDEVEQYEPWQRRRLRMRPGLTCIWVLEGRSDVDFHRWIQLDLAYIDNWSLWLDCKIFFRTIPIVISGRGAY
jgi:exopolysaccharide biosynthesis polyprenyl glycosylphosphotransferase